MGDRDRQSMSRGGAEGEGDTESEAGSRLWAVSTEPDAGLELTNCTIMTWAKVGCLTNWATQAPRNISLYIFKCLSDNFETETECKQGGAEIEGDTESEAGSRLRGVSTEHDVGLELTDREIMTWAEVGRLTNWATQAPQNFF